MSGAPMSDHETARSLAEDIFASLPGLWRFHGRHRPLYHHLNGAMKAYFAGVEDERIGIRPFADVIWPRISLGNAAGSV